MLSLNILTAACIFGVVSATPLGSRQLVTCNPNFEGAGVSIIAGDVEWGVSPVVAGTPLANDVGTHPPNATANWHVEQTGSANATYVIKAISNNNLVVDVVDRQLTLENIDPSGATQSQLWEIDCKQCFQGASSTPGGGEFAVGCAIKSLSTGSCASLEMGSPFLGTVSASCDLVAADTFNFWTATGA